MYLTQCPTPLEPVSLHVTVPSKLVFTGPPLEHRTTGLLVPTFANNHYLRELCQQTWHLRRPALVTPCSATRSISPRLAHTLAQPIDPSATLYHTSALHYLYLVDGRGSNVEMSVSGWPWVAKDPPCVFLGNRINPYSITESCCARRHGRTIVYFLNLSSSCQCASPKCCVE
ncbi:hypothetical protein BDV95DRAFT_309832 [Massariosphaeria phaeospora]|uniref:Uncharacterized protein n=1 Tax=Massariosphaeria phaeospora TaxID=100035 RepID=A0A7C8IB17_9PLEO|nr:hypothetical protein BDV95DRAFT_309832 [Massariosphaeria phaeospora]